MTAKNTILFLVGLTTVFGYQLGANAQSPFSSAANSNQPLIKTVGTNLRSFGVPFKVNANNESFIEVQLYMSRDMGKTWQFYARQSTDRQDFPFEAEQDGEYWFSLKTLDRDRRLVPEGDPQAELKIVVDTVKPTLDFRIESDAAGRVVCRWQASDQNLAPESLQIYYQPITELGPGKDWVKVPVELNGTSRNGVYADQIAWWPETTQQQLNVVVEIRDIADNVVQVDRQIVVPQTAWRHRSQSTAQITDSPASAISAEYAWGDSDDAGFANDPSQQTARHSPPIPPNMVCKDGVCMPAPETQNSTNAKMVGSEVELAAPPNPESYGLASRQFAARPNIPVKGQDSVVWQSDSESLSPGNQSIVGSTMRPNPSVAPILNPNQPPSQHVTNVQSNPSTMTHRGDQVVGESSTMGQHNQYRGLDNQNGLSIPDPELLPDVAGYQPTGRAMPADHYPNTGHPGFEQLAQPAAGSGFQPSGFQPRDSQPSVRTMQSKPATGAGQWTQPGDIGNKQEFSNAGFANPNRAPRDATSQTADLSNRDTRAPTQIIGSKRFRLDYGIDAIDPSGVAKVDLWMTRDFGRTWNAWGSDPDNQSPFPVEVQAEGLYGFRIVVHSKDGLTGQGPSSGDDADMWITVDTRSPLTRITSVPYGRGDEAGRLVINYSVADSSLTLRPIKLGYSQNPTGPWIVIEEGLRNEGRYVWKPQSNVPDRIFLQIEAIDKAGNVGAHILSQAIDVSGLVPRGTIRGVSPVGIN